MSNPGQSNMAPIENRAQLIDVLARGAKPKSDWKIGTEHEKFGFVLPDHASAGRQAFAPPPYRPLGIEAMLLALKEENNSQNWDGIYEGESLIGLRGKGVEMGRSISLEPAGQFELSGAPLATLHETKQEMARHFESLKGPASSLGLGFAPLGFQPLWSRDAMPWMPKSRYEIMRHYMPKVGKFGLDMMTRTCTVQVNLDFSNEADMARKMRVALALQPLATALFANAPFIGGRPNGWLSNRARIWLDTDQARSGQPALFFEDGFGFERYVDWVLDVPMYFVNRDGKNIDVAGCSFRYWLEGKFQARLAGLTPTIGDFEDHLTTVFPDVRLKQFLEMRGADAGTPAMMLAQSAFWVGLLYTQNVLEEAERLVRHHPWQAYQKLRADVAEFGLAAPFGGAGGLRGLLRAVLALSEHGLKARHLDEENFIAPLHMIADGKPVQAEYWLSRYYDVWQGDITRIFMEAAI